MEVPIPMKELLTMFRNGVESFQLEILLPSTTTQYDGAEDVNPDFGTDSSEESEMHKAKGFLGSSTNLDTMDGRTGQILDVESEGEDNESVSPTHRRASMTSTIGDAASKQRVLVDRGSPIVSEDEEAPTPDETVGLLSTTRGPSVGASLKKSRKVLQRKRDSGPRSKSTVARTESGLQIQEEFVQSQQLSRTRRISRSQPRQSITIATLASDHVAISGHDHISNGPATSSHSGPSGSGSRRQKRQGRKRLRHGEQPVYRATECLAQMLNIAYRQAS